MDWFSMERLVSVEQIPAAGRENPRFSQTFGFLIPSQAGFPLIFVASPFQSPPEAGKQGQHHSGDFPVLVFLAAFGLWDFTLEG